MPASKFFLAREAASAAYDACAPLDEAGLRHLRRLGRAWSKATQAYDAALARAIAAFEALPDCAAKWNADEASFDCLDHGADSRDDLYRIGYALALYDDSEH